jgi:hypothetical protein
MTYTAKFAVYSEIRIKHSTQSEHHVEFFNIKLGGTERNRRTFKGYIFFQNVFFSWLGQVLLGLPS